MKTPKAIEVIQQYREWFHNHLDELGNNKYYIEDLLYMDDMPELRELDKALSKAVEVMGNIDRVTPFKCSETKEPLFIGDYVENNEKRCGTLQFDTYINGYVIKTKDGGNIKTKHFTKIKELYDYNIVNANVECRRTNKRKW